jgi:hypothetical protein
MNTIDAASTSLLNKKNEIKKKPLDYYSGFTPSYKDSNLVLKEGCWSRSLNLVRNMKARTGNDETQTIRIIVSTDSTMSRVP